ncbi:MAG: 50S ribosomal protein L15e [Candidatus Nanoarchaeia archaeon]
MGYAKYLSELWTKPKENFGTERWRAWLMSLRREPAIVRLEKPTRLDKARLLGYKAIQGIFIVRSRVPKGGRKRPKPGHGRRPKRYGRFIETRKSKQLIAEQRAARKFPNAEVINSYWVGEDGKYAWYEVIMADRAQASKHPSFAWLANPANKRRVYRGLTSAGKKSRGLRKKGPSATKFRPSKRSKGTK